MEHGFLLLQEQMTTNVVALKQHKFKLQLSGLEVRKGSHWVKVKMVPGLCLPLSGSHLHSLAHGPLSASSKPAMAS